MNIQFDMTKGPIAGQLFRFAFPLMLTYVLQTGYGAADMLIVSRFAGEEGVAAVSNGSTLAFLIASFCMGFGSGGAVLIGSCAACGDKTAQQRTIAVLCGLTVLLSAAVTAVGLAVSESAVSLLGVPEAIHAATLEYTRILCSGTVFVFGPHMVCAVLRALATQCCRFFWYSFQPCSISFWILFSWDFSADQRQGPQRQRCWRRPGHSPFP